MDNRGVRTQGCLVGMIRHKGQEKEHDEVKEKRGGHGTGKKGEETLHGTGPWGEYAFRATGLQG